MFLNVIFRWGRGEGEGVERMGSFTFTLVSLSSLSMECNLSTSQQGEAKENGVRKKN